MKKGWKRIGFCLLLVTLVWTAGLIFDRQTLHNELIRLHVVANSDSTEDQEIKLRVRDAVTESLEAALADIASVEEAEAYIRENLPKIRETANQVLREAGIDQEAIVALCEEAFDTRHYDTFSLPAGVYEALRITIGNGEGKNWWCVVFPTLCVPAASEGFEEVAVGAGFSKSLSGCLAGEETYAVRFFLLDALGKLENMLFQE